MEWDGAERRTGNCEQHEIQMERVGKIDARMDDLLTKQLPHLCRQLEKVLTTAKVLATVLGLAWGVGAALVGYVTRQATAMAHEVTAQGARMMVDASRLDGIRTELDDHSDRLRKVETDLSTHTATPHWWKEKGHQ